MTDRSIEAVEASQGGLRALRLRLAEADAGEVARREPAGSGLRVAFDVHGRPLALEIREDEPVDRDRIDEVLEVLGQPGLSEEERALLDAAL